MKKIFAIAMILLVICQPLAIAEKDLGVSTQILLAMYEGYLEPTGLPVMSLDLNEKEKTADRIIKAVDDDITLMLHQSNGMATMLAIIADVGKEMDNAVMQKVVFCMMGVMMTVDMKMDSGNVLNNIDLVLQNRELTINGFKYSFTSSAPMDTLVSFAVEPA